MRAVIKLELIGDNFFAYRRFGKRTLPQYERNLYYMTQPRFRSWVARLKRGGEREFLEGFRDYTFATSTGSRGIFIYYSLVDGVYEVNERTSWTKSRRYFVLVSGMEISEISKETAWQTINAI